MVKLLLEWVPLLIFFIAMVQYDIYLATVVLMVTLPLQTLIFWLVYKHTERFHLITTLLVWIFGGATLLLHDPMFIKWKPTVINWLFALVFLLSPRIGKKPMIQRLLEQKLVLPSHIWFRLNSSWIVFFTMLGFTNLYVAYHFDDLVWAKFKVFGLLGLTLSFILIQGIYLNRFISHPNDRPSEK